MFKQKDIFWVENVTVKRPVALQSMAQDLESVCHKHSQNLSVEWFNHEIRIGIPNEYVNEIHFNISAH